MKIVTFQSLVCRLKKLFDPFGSEQKKLQIVLLALFALMLLVFPGAVSSLEELPAENEAAVALPIDAEQHQQNEDQENLAMVNESEADNGIENGPIETDNQLKSPDSKSFDVKFGERPPINLDKVPSDAMEEGKIYLKLKPQAGQILETVGLKYSGAGFAITGIEQVDLLNKQYGVTRFDSLFAGLYDTKSKSNQYVDRHRAWGLHLWYELSVDTKYDLKEVVRVYNRLDEVETADPVYKKQLHWTPDDPQFTNQWHYHNTGQQVGTAEADIDLVRAWDIEKGNPVVIVAIIDEGIQFNHPDIAANMWAKLGWNFVNDSATINPGDHGTHVAGTVAAVSNNETGVAGIAGGSGAGDGVRLMSCQVFDGNSQGGQHLALVYAADNGAAISQNSWGYTSPDVFDVAILDAIDYFNNNGGGDILDGGITIFAAGNNNDSGNWYPGYYSGAMAVAATNNQDKKAYYSNFGSWVEISAPGGETNSVLQSGVLSTITGNSYQYYQGTSMACPHVSGVAALIVSKAPGQLAAAEVREILKDTTDDHYADNPTYTGQLGTGRLNAYYALQTIVTGSLQVTIEPLAAHLAGAQWRLVSPDELFFHDFNDVNGYHGWIRTPEALWSLTSIALETGGESEKLVTAYNTGTYTDLNYSVRMRRIDSDNSINAIAFRTGDNFDSTERIYPAYRFGYANTGVYNIIRFNTDGTYTLIQDWTPSSAIVENGWNILRVVAVGDTFECYINDTLVRTFTDSSIGSGHVGVAMYNDDSDPPSTRLEVDWAALTQAPASVGMAAVDPGQEALNRAAMEAGADSSQEYYDPSTQGSAGESTANETFSEAPVPGERRTSDYAPESTAAESTSSSLLTGYSYGWENSGESITGLPPGTYTITFKDISDVSALTVPPDINVNITAGAAVTRTGTYTYTGQSFSDVPPGHTFYKDIEAIKAAKITGGYPDGTYGPTNHVTRGQMAAFLARALSLTDPGTGPTFTDVPPGHTFYKEIEALAAAGIAGGYGDGTYGPADPVTRGQMAAFLTRAFSLTDPGTGPTFTDVPPGHTFYKDIEALAASGITGGYGDGTYGPADPVTRGQMAAFLARALGLHN